MFIAPYCGRGWIKMGQMGQHRESPCGTYTALFSSADCGRNLGLTFVQCKTTPPLGLQLSTTWMDSIPKEIEVRKVRQSSGKLVLGEQYKCKVGEEALGFRIAVGEEKGRIQKCPHLAKQ